MTVASMRELLLRGESGSIALGSPPQDVLASLGEPTDRSQIEPPILKHGPLELAFRADRLVLAAYHAGRPDNQYALNVRSDAVVLFVDGELSSVQLAG